MPSTHQQTARQRISDFQELVNRQQNRIRQLGDKAWKGLTARKEDHRVHEFLSSTHAGTALLNRDLVPLLSQNGWVVKFASIFLHQMPMVKGTLPTGQPLARKCELGDLQTLFVYLRADKTVLKMRSVIFQAKMAPHITGHVIDHPIQRALYDDCTSFIYESVLPGTPRTMPAGADREKAFQYLFIGDYPARTRTIPSALGYGAFQNYGEHLLRFLNDSTGLEVQPETSTQNDWSRTVWDMIEHVAEKFTTSGKARQRGIQDILDYFNSFEKHDRVFFTPPPSGGGKDAGKGKGGYGIQFVIVWDSELDGGQELQPLTPLEKIRTLAGSYHELEPSSDPMQVKQRDHLSQEMAALLHDHELTCQKVLATADAPHHRRWFNGLAAAAAQTIADSSDVEYLFENLSHITSEHTLLLVLHALDAYLKEYSHPSYNHVAEFEALLRRSPFANSPKVKEELSRMQTNKTTHLSTKAHTKQPEKIRLMQHA